MNRMTADTGTTNTRAAVWHGSRGLGRAILQVGVRDRAICGKSATLQAGVRDTMDAALARCGLEACGIGRAPASVMLRSDLGLHALSHRAAPA